MAFCHTVMCLKFCCQSLFFLKCAARLLGISMLAGASQPTKSLTQFDMTNRYLSSPIFKIRPNKIKFIDSYLPARRPVQVTKFSIFPIVSFIFFLFISIQASQFSIVEEGSISIMVYVCVCVCVCVYQWGLRGGQGRIWTIDMRLEALHHAVCVLHGFGFQYLFCDFF